jgi:hypothetical protein
MTITGGQIREARALLEGSTSKLSVKAGLGTAIHQFEFCERLISRTALHMLRAPPRGPASNSRPTSEASEHGTTNDRIAAKCKAARKLLGWSLEDLAQKC